MNKVQGDDDDDDDDDDLPLSPTDRCVQLIITQHTRVGSGSGRTQRGATRMRTVAGHPPLLLAASLQKTRLFITIPLPRTTLLRFFFSFKLLRPFYIFVQIAQPTRTKRKDQSAQEEPFERGVSVEEVGRDRNEARDRPDDEYGSRRVAGHILLPRPCLLGSLALPASSSLCRALRLREFLALGSFLLVLTSG
jgi:hypothetical protein